MNQQLLTDFLKGEDIGRLKMSGKSGVLGSVVGEGGLYCFKFVQ